MISIYQTTQKGQQTRDKILEILREQDGLSREEICDRGLSYAQVRRQTGELVSQGKIRSRTEGLGKKRYFVVYTIVLSLACSVPVFNNLFEDSHGDDFGDRSFVFTRRNGSKAA